jgi:predicted type IV restriction endonuclease
MLKPLNLPIAELKLTRKAEELFVWCIIRKKELKLTPEEWVRQHIIHYLVHHRGFPQGLLSSEFSIVVNDLQRRCDLVVFNREGTPLLIVECKAPEVILDQNVFIQIAQYNFKMGVEYLLISNGIDHVIMKVDTRTGEINYLDDLPQDLFS